LDSRPPDEVFSSVRLSEILRDQPVAPARDWRTVFQTVLHRLVAPQNVCLSREAETVLDTLDIPRDAMWHDVDGRPHELYRADPIVF